MKTLKLFISAIALLTTVSTSYAQKNLGMETSPNFRELGGIQINEKYHIKDGMIYRSGSFSNLPATDKEKLMNTNINTVVDFRSDFEIEKEPDDLPEAMGAKWIHSPIGKLDPNTMGQFMKIMKNDNFRKESLDSMMVVFNRNFVNNIPDYKPFFENLQKPNAVVLFHCSAGKDRTGLASSLFLHTLGADWDTIMTDFLRSNEATSKIDDNKLAMYGIPKERAQHLMGVQPKYLEAAWEGIREKYGSVDKMLKKEFGIGKKEKKALRKKYLEKE